MVTEAPDVEDGVCDEPRAHALYDQMVAVLRAADSLSYQSTQHWEAGGREHRHGTYQLWMKKPNLARLESVSDGVSGVLVLDGEQLWIYWLTERPFLTPADPDEEAWKKTRSHVYMKIPAPPARHSIKHQIGWWLRVTSILEPSVFHGYSDPLEPYMDGVRSLGTEELDGEQCDGIEVSFMDHQRSWYLWLAQCDHLPRRLRQVVRLGKDQRMEESWSKIIINAPIPEEQFVWAPPAGWSEWRPQSFEESLLKPGTPAPDFSLKGLEGEALTLSSFRGNVVWLAIWRAG